MAKLEDIVEEVLLNVEGYSGDQDIYGTLTSSITASATTFTLAGPSFPDGSGFSTGIMEIGEELVYVQEYDRSTGVATGVLRGWRGTTATTHSAGKRVRNNPKYPLIATKRAINDTIKALYPRLFAVKTVELNVNGARYQYDLPSDAINILSVHVNVPGASKVWVPAKRWTFNNTAGSNSDSGKTITVFDGLPGYPVQVVYSAEPSTLEIGDDFQTVTGLPDFTREIVVYGACWRLVSFMDSPRVSNMLAEQSLLNEQVPVGSAERLAKYFLGMYNQRIFEAEARMKMEYRPKKHYIL
jgi:hypothetical protein